MSAPDRRSFLRTASAAGAGMLVASRAGPLLALNGSPNEKLVVAVMGVNSRGEVHLQNFALAKNAEIAYVCDVDSRALASSSMTVRSWLTVLPRRPLPVTSSGASLARAWSLASLADERSFFRHESEMC